MTIICCFIKTHFKTAVSYSKINNGQLLALSMQHSSTGNTNNNDEDINNKNNTKHFPLPEE